MSIARIPGSSFSSNLTPCSQGPSTVPTHEGMSNISGADDRFSAFLEHEKRMKFENDFATARRDIAQHLQQPSGVDKIYGTLVTDSGLLALTSLGFGTDSPARRAQEIFTDYCMNHTDEDVVSILRIHSSMVIYDDPLVEVEDKEDLDSSLEHICLVMQCDTISTASGWILLHYYNQRYTTMVKTFLGEDYRWFRSITDFLSLDDQNDSNAFRTESLERSPIVD